MATETGFRSAGGGDYHTLSTFDTDTGLFLSSRPMESDPSSCVLYPAPPAGTGRHQLDTEADEMGLSAIIQHHGRRESDPFLPQGRSAGLCDTRTHRPGYYHLLRRAGNIRALCPSYLSFSTLYLPA